MGDVWDSFELQFLPGRFPKEQAAICSRVVLSYLQPVEDSPLIAKTGATAVFQGSLRSFVWCLEYSYSGLVDDMFMRTMLLHWLNIQDRGCHQVSLAEAPLLLQTLKKAQVGLLLQCNLACSQLSCASCIRVVPQAIIGAWT